MNKEVTHTPARDRAQSTGRVRRTEASEPFRAHATRQLVQEAPR